jgi:hypothetical protein
MMNFDKLIKVVFRGIALSTIAVGTFFSFLIAKLEDAPGIIFIGVLSSFIIALILFGLCEIIIQIIRTNKLLSELNEKLDK